MYPFSPHFLFTNLLSAVDVFDRTSFTTSLFQLYFSGTRK